MAVAETPARAATRGWLLVTLLAGTGCVPAFQTRANNVAVVPARIASLPAITMAYQLDLDDKEKPLDAWAAAMAKRLNGEVTRWVARAGGHAFPGDHETDAPAAYAAFLKWAEVAMVEIAAQKTGRANFHLDSVDKWRFKQNLDWLKELVEADFVLVTLFRDVRPTTGRLLGDVSMARLTYWLQVGVACVVDLKDGRMVWCNAKSDAWGDLSVETTAHRAISQLLTDLYYPPKPGTWGAEGPEKD